MHCNLFSIGELSSQSHFSPVKFIDVEVRVRDLHDKSYSYRSYQTNHCCTCKYRTRLFRVRRESPRSPCNCNRTPARLRPPLEILQRLAHPRSRLFVSKEHGEHYRNGKRFELIGFNYVPIDSRFSDTCRSTEQPWSRTPGLLLYPRIQRCSIPGGSCCHN